MRGAHRRGGVNEGEGSREGEVVLGNVSYYYDDETSIPRIARAANKRAVSLYERLV